MHPLMLDLLPWVRQGYCCSQLLLKLMLQAMNRENTDVLACAKGLCHGIGQSDGPCGLLTGGAAALALVGDHPMLTPMLHDYYEWFVARTEPYGGSNCPQVAQGLGAQGAAPDPVACGDLLCECWQEILLLLQSYDIDLTSL